MREKVTTLAHDWGNVCLVVSTDPLYSHPKLLGCGPAVQVYLAWLAGALPLCPVITRNSGGIYTPAVIARCRHLLHNLLGDGQHVQVHELRQLVQLLHILDLLTKLSTVICYIVIYSAFTFVYLIIGLKKL